MELHDIDREGNRLPVGMFWRDGFYYVRATVAGKRLKKSTGKADFKSALRRYHEIMLAWNNQESGWDSKASPTLKDFWFKDYRPKRVVGKKTPNRNSKDDYRDDSLIAAVLVEMGHRKLSDISKSLAEKWVQKRRGMTFQRKKGGTQYPLAEGTVSREIAFLRTLFGQAVTDELIERNPWGDIEVEPYEVKDRVLTFEEQARLEAALPVQFQRFLNFMLGTGLRIQEARGINEKIDLFLDKKQIRVTRKTRGLKKKVQLIPLFDENVVEVLKEQLEDKGQLWHQCPTRLNGLLRTGAIAAGIEHVTPHTLRHTFATRYLQNGGDIYILSKLLGHASVKTTEKIYAHLLSEDLGTLSAHVSLGVGVAGKVLPFKKGLTA